MWAGQYCNMMQDTDLVFEDFLQGRAEKFFC